jgi:hypothetical protein
VLICAGRATRWEGEASVHRREDRIDVIALSLAQFGPGLPTLFGYCRSVNDLNALLRARQPDAFSDVMQVDRRRRQGAAREFLRRGALDR